MADATSRPVLDDSILEDKPTFDIKEIRAGRCTDKTISLVFSLARSDNGNGIERLEADTTAPVVGTMGTHYSEASIAMQIAEKLNKWRNDQLLCFQVEKAYNTVTASLASWVSSGTWEKLPLIKAKGPHIHKNSFNLVITDLEADTPYSFRVRVHSKGGDGPVVQVAAATLTATAAAEQAYKEEEDRIRKLDASRKAKLAASRDAAAGIASKPGAAGVARDTDAPAAGGDAAGGDATAGDAAGGDAAGGDATAGDAVAVDAAATSS